MPETKRAPSASWHLPRRVAYVVSHSYPYSSNGYAVRTHAVANALNGLGHEVIVFNKPGRPWDIEGFPADISVKTEQVIDNVRYVFLPCAGGAETGVRDRLRDAERTLMEALRIFRPGTVLGVSNWENAEPAQNAARRLKIPFFYEQRGFWEMSRAASDPAYAHSEEYARNRRNEVRIAQAAQAVFTLNGAMRDELVRRGVPGGNIHLVPNGVSAPGHVDRAITRSSIGCRSRYLLGYIGSLSDYEGSEDLLHLLEKLRRMGVDADMMIMGSSAPKGLIGSDHDAPLEIRLRDLAQSLKIAGHVHFLPQVAANRTGAYYSMTDAFIMPRRRAAVTELVAPLKPYAAASYNLPVFMTDMAPLDEIAQDIHASLFPEGDMDTLADMVRQTLEQGGHPAVMNPLPQGVFWPERVQPMSRLLRDAAQSLAGVSEGLWASGGAQVGAYPAPGSRLFDTHILPQVALRGQLGIGTIAALGPCRHITGARLIRLTRSNILASLATGDVGAFVIDWAGLQDGPAEWPAEWAAEWAGLWSIDNMRLNRQIMDACRIALDRGWTMQVLGPVSRSQAPLYRTVSGVLEEILPGPETQAPEATQ